MKTYSKNWAREGKMMKMYSSLTKAILLALVLMLLGPSTGWTTFPEKPIQVLVGWPVGSQNDMIDRAIAERLQKILKQPIIVQNVPGAGAALVLGRVKIEKPDGYTLFQTGTAMYSRTAHLRQVPFDIFNDFEYLANHAIFQYVLLDRPDNPWKNYDEMIAYVKKNPNTVRYSTSGVGTSMHLIMEYIAMRENLKWIHIPFTGGSEAVAALLGGHVNLYSGALSAEVEQVRTGRLRFLISTTPKRNSVFPQFPTVLEKGYDYSIYGGACWTVPKGTPKEIKTILENALLESFKDPVVVDFITNKYMMVMDPLNGAALWKMIKEDYEISGELLKKMGLGIYKK